MDRKIKPMEEKYLLPSLDMIENVLAAWGSPEETRTLNRVRALREG